MKKEIYSKNYGEDPKEGIHVWLLKNIKGYKRSKIQFYLEGFAKYLGKPEKNDSSELASQHFEKWKIFAKQK